MMTTREMKTGKRLPSTSSLRCLHGNADSVALLGVRDPGDILNSPTLVLNPSLACAVRVSTFCGYLGTYSR